MLENLAPKKVLFERTRPLISKSKGLAGEGEGAVFYNYSTVLYLLYKARENVMTMTITALLSAGRGRAPAVAPAVALAALADSRRDDARESAGASRGVPFAVPPGGLSASAPATWAAARPRDRRLCACEGLPGADLPALHVRQRLTNASTTASLKERYEVRATGCRLQPRGLWPRSWPQRRRSWPCLRPPLPMTLLWSWPGQLRSWTGRDQGGEGCGRGRGQGCACLGRECGHTGGGPGRGHGHGGEVVTEVMATGVEVIAETRGHGGGSCGCGQGYK